MLGYKSVLLWTGELEKLTGGDHSADDQGGCEECAMWVMRDGEGIKEQQGDDEIQHK